MQCSKCGNDTRTSELVTAHGPVMLSGTLGTDPQPILAQACTACGYIELYGPQPINQPRQVRQAQQVVPQVEAELVPVPPVTQ